MGLFSGISKAISSVSSAISPISGIIGAGLGYLGQQQANQTNVDIASANNATSIELANTAYQRRVKDLIAAGLNPMLAYAQGGAQVPSLQQARVENTAASATKSGMDAVSMDLMRSQVATQETQAQANSAQAAKTMAEKTSIDLANQRDAANVQSRTFVEAKELDARQAKALLDRFKYSNDQNSISFLNEQARKFGYRTMEEAVTSVAFKQQLLDLYQSKLENPKLEAFSNMYKSDFGKSIAPYLNSGEQATRIIKNVVPRR